MKLQAFRGLLLFQIILLTECSFLEKIRTLLEEVQESDRSKQDGVLDLDPVRQWSGGQAAFKTGADETGFEREPRPGSEPGDWTPLMFANSVDNAVSAIPPEFGDTRQGILDSWERIQNKFWELKMKAQNYSPNLGLKEEALLNFPRATLYSGPNFTGSAIRYEFARSIQTENGCTNLVGRALSLDPHGTCVRLHKVEDCTGAFFQVSNSTQRHLETSLNGELWEAKSVGPCIKNNFEFSKFESGPLITMEDAQDLKDVLDFVHDTLFGKIRV